MTIVVVLKVLHYVSLFLAGGLGVANVMLLESSKAGMPPAPASPKNNDDVSKAWFNRNRHTLADWNTFNL